MAIPVFSSSAVSIYCPKEGKKGEKSGIGIYTMNRNIECQVMTNGDE
jgi:hypothetical protein